MLAREPFAKRGLYMKKGESLREKIYHNIRDAITYGMLSAGEQIYEETFAERFNTSRTPVREAIRQLQTEGYLRVVSNKGAFVAKISLEDLKNIYDLLALLESYATEQFIKRLTKDSVVQLQRLHENVCKAAQDNDVRLYYDNNTEFHLLFTRLSGNAHLKKMVVMLRDQIYRTHYIGITIPGHFAEYIDDHTQILKAVINKDVIKGKESMRFHIRRTRDILINHLKNFEYPNHKPK
jgi:DNA-binding GntR family transcriptional regulator